jgi:hypothetical protein
MDGELSVYIYEDNVLGYPYALTPNVTCGNGTGPAQEGKGLSFNVF